MGEFMSTDLILAFLLGGTLAIIGAMIGFHQKKVCN
jgi:hypothetical protein